MPCYNIIFNVNYNVTKLPLPTRLQKVPKALVKPIKSLKSNLKVNNAACLETFTLLSNHRVK